MLRKILRHDSRAILNRLFPIFMAMLGTGVLQLILGTVSGVLYPSTGYNALYGTLQGVYILLWVALAVLTVYAAFVSLAHYYQSLFTDEGYFTMTVPVKMPTLFFGKLLSGMLWLVISFLIGAAAVMIGCFDRILADLTAFVTFFAELPELFSSFFLIDLPSALVGFVAMCVRFYAAVTVGGCMFRRHKIVGTVLCYYLFSTVSSVVLGIAALPLLWIPPSSVNAMLVLTIVTTTLVYAAEAAVLSILSIRTLAHRFDID